MNVTETDVPKSADAAEAARDKISARLLRRVWDAFGIDQAIFFSLLGTVRGMVGGPLIALLITLHFTPVVQGFYYTFSSVLGLQVFAELGLSAVLLQFASHEWSGLRFESGRITGRLDNLSRLAHIVRLAGSWYGVVGTMSAFGLSVGGYFFFRAKGYPEVTWIAPWLCLCFLTGLKLFFTPFFSILEGCGQVRQVYGYRLTEGLLTTVVAVTAISAGAGLWTTVILSLVVLVANAIFLMFLYGTFFRSLLSVKISARLNWKAEMLPMQWRIALSWMSGYFAFQFFTPVLFQYQGPVVAGQFGLAWSLTNTVSSVSTAWINTKVPQFGALIARREFKRLDHLAKRALFGALTVSALGSAAAILALYGLGHWFPNTARRFLPVLPCAVLLGAGVLLQISHAQSSYLRAHKREPFLWLSVFGSALIGLSAWYFGSRYGVLQMTWGYLAVVVVFTLPIGTVIFANCRAKWHAP